VDTETEAQIFEHFRSLTKDRIAILISHRFSTVRYADQIVEEIVRTTVPSSLAPGAYAQQSA
jgi:ABC-type transport system involved in Fe-S cluster assembly fused permease/ATPase subunit